MGHGLNQECKATGGLEGPRVRSAPVNPLPGPLVGPLIDPPTRKIPAHEVLELIHQTSRRLDVLMAQGPNRQSVLGHRKAEAPSSNVTPKRKVSPCPSGNLNHQLETLEWWMVGVALLAGGWLCLLLLLLP